MKSYENRLVNLKITTSTCSSGQGMALMQKNSRFKVLRPDYNQEQSLYLRSSTKMLKVAILFYRSILSIHVGGGCRFQPSCSEYALEAADKFEFTAATKLIFRRLMKCHPWGPFGIDPVPERTSLK